MGIVIVSSLALSCVREVEIDLGPLPDRIVLNASISPDREIGAHVSKTWFLMDSVPDFELPGATIRVYVNGAYQGDMRNDDTPDDSLHLKGQYVLPGGFARTGDRVRLEAYAAGFEPVSAETYIPRRAEVLGVDTMGYQTSPDRAGRMRFHIRLGEVPDGYYRLIVEQVTEYRKGDERYTYTSFQGTGGDSAPSGGYAVPYDYRPTLTLDYEDPAFQPTGGSPITNSLDGRYCMGVFASENLSGADAITVSAWPVTYSYRSDTLSTEVRFDVRLLSISEDYYRYMKIMRGFSIVVGDADFGALVEPADTYSNVRGGFGIVAGYQESRVRLVMPVGDEPPRWTPWNAYGYPYEDSYNAPKTRPW